MRPSGGNRSVSVPAEPAAAPVPARPAASAIPTPRPVIPMQRPPTPARPTESRQATAPPPVANKAPALPNRDAPPLPKVAKPNKSEEDLSSKPPPSRPSVSAKGPPPPVPTRPRSVTAGSSNATGGSNESLNKGSVPGRNPPPPPSRGGGAPKIPPPAPNKPAGSRSNESLNRPAAAPPPIPSRVSPSMDRKPAPVPGKISAPVLQPSGPVSPQPGSTGQSHEEFEGRWKFHNDTDLPPPRPFAPQSRYYLSGATTGSQFSLESLLSMAQLTRSSPSAGRRAAPPPPPNRR